MRIYLLALFTISLFYACSSIRNPAVEKEIDYHYSVGVVRLSEHDYQGALDALNKALKLNPSHKESINAIGLIYLGLKEYENAIKFFEKAIRIDGKFIEARNNLGAAYSLSGKPDLAIKTFNQILEDPFLASSVQAVNTYRNLAEIYFRKGMTDRAINLLKQTLSITPNSAQAYYLLALCYNAKEMYGYAMDALNAAIENDPRFVGDNEKALKAFNLTILRSTGTEKKDAEDFLEILNY